MIQHISRWALGAVGPIALFAPKGLYIPLLIISVLGILTHKFKNARHLVTPVWISLFAFILWMGLSYFWSMNPRVSLLTLEKVTPILATAPLLYLYFKSLSLTEFNRHLGYFFKGMWICVGILVIDYFLDYPLIDIIHTNRSATYSRFMTTLCLAIWLFELTQRYPRYRIAFSLLSIATSAWVMWPYDFDAGPIALILGCAVAGATVFAPKIINKVLSASIAVAPILIALMIGHLMTQDHWHKIAKHETSGPMQQRLEFIHWASKALTKSPAVGIGVGQTPELSIVSPIQSYVTIDGTWKEISMFESGVQHLHNGLLQILLELGIVGSLLLGTFIFLLIQQGYKQISDQINLALMHGYVTSVIFIVCVSFGIWQIWWLSVIILLTLLFALRVSDEGQNTNHHN